MKKRFGCLVFLLMTSAASSLEAETITFDGYQGAGRSVPVTTYSEAGFTLNRLSGDLNASNINYGGAPDLYTTSQGSFSLVNGGLFNFSSFDVLLGSAEPGSYQVIGFLSGVQLYSATYALTSGSKVTFRSPSNLTVDTLQFNLAGFSTVIDNIVVNPVIASNPAAAVPEPATWAMMIFGLGVVGYSMRRQQKVRACLRFA